MATETRSDQNAEKLLNMQAAADYLGISYVSIWRELKKKNSKLKYYKIGGCKRFSPSRHLQPFLESCEKN